MARASGGILTNVSGKIVNATPHYAFVKNGEQFLANVSKSASISKSASSSTSDKALGRRYVTKFMSSLTNMLHVIYKAATQSLPCGAIAADFRMVYVSGRAYWFHESILDSFDALWNQYGPLSDYAKKMVKGWGTNRQQIPFFVFPDRWDGILEGPYARYAFAREHCDLNIALSADLDWANPRNIISEYQANSNINFGRDTIVKSKKTKEYTSFRGWLMGKQFDVPLLAWFAFYPHLARFTGYDEFYNPGIEMCREVYAALGYRPLHLWRWARCGYDRMWFNFFFEDEDTQNEDWVYGLKKAYYNSQNKLYYKELEEYKIYNNLKPPKTE